MDKLIYLWRCIVTWWTNSYDLDDHYETDSIIAIKRFGEEQFYDTNRQINEILERRRNDIRPRKR